MRVASLAGVARRSVFALSLALTALCALPRPVRAQEAAPRYTAAQAEAGKEIFGRVCAVCHMPDLSGGPIAPPLTGTYFAGDWGGRTAAQLIAFATAEMPQTAPGSLDQDSYLRVISYILSMNGVPAADTPLTVADQGIIKIPTK